MLLEGILSEGYEGYFHSGFPPPFVKGEDWIFERNEIRGERKFFKIKGERGIFEIFIGGTIAGDQTSNRKQNFRMNLKMFS